jgi:hypothetical protein
MSKIVSMPSNNTYRENWDRIFGKSVPENTHTESQEQGNEKSSGCGCGCGCGKKSKKGNA